MNLSKKLSLALEQAHLPPLKTPTSYRKLGSGAWHTAYLVYPTRGDRLVVRLRKQIIYGQREIFNKKELREDYEPVGLYYRLANQCQPGLCPAIYEYVLDPDLSFTIESYLGPTLSLARLSQQQAVAYGQQVGAFFRKMHTMSSPVAGFGALYWHGTRLEGQHQGSLAEIYQEERDTFYRWLDHLARGEFRF